jgi:hypothetical protein
MQGAHSVISYHGHSVVKALIELFPSVTFDKSKFLKGLSLYLLCEFFVYISISDWSKIDTRRKLFENYARKQNFDPLVAENWRKHTKNIMSVKVLISILFILSLIIIIKSYKYNYCNIYVYYLTQVLLGH